MISRFALPILLGALVLLASAYSVVVPLGEAPDEVPHWSYIEYLVEHQRLPPPEGPVAGESHQPPLYYLIGAVATAWIPHQGFQVSANPDFVLGDPRTPNLLLHDRREAFPYQDDVLAWHLARLLSIAMGAATVWTTAQIAREIFPDDPWIAMGAAAFIAFLPGFVFVSAVANNDNLIVMLSSLCILQTARMLRVRFGTRDAARLGILLGLAALTKLSGLVIWLFTGVLFFVLAFKSENWKTTAIHTALCFGIAMTIVAPWMIYNLLNYGDPLGWSLILSTTPIRQSPMTISDWVGTAQGLYTSFWGRFGGAVQIRMPNTIYAALGVVGLAALVGWVGYARDMRAKKLASGTRAAFLLFVLFWLLALAAHVRWVLTVLGADQARQLFPGLPLLAIFLIAGLARFFGARYKIALAALSSVLFALSIAALIYLNSIYAPSFLD